jgi:predicted CoA-binding protein
MVWMQEGIIHKEAGEKGVTGVLKVMRDKARAAMGLACMKIDVFIRPPRPIRV